MAGYKQGDPRGSATVTGRQRAGAGATAVALAATMSLLGVWEGKRNDPYYDSVHVQTVCYGETRVQMRHYSDQECSAMLERGAEGFQKLVLRRNPALVRDPYMLAAHTSMAYNLGIGTYTKSSVAILYAAGRKADACHAIALYRRAGGRVLPGLVMRRNGDVRRMGEVEVCLLPYP